MAAPGDSPELLGRVQVAPGQAVAAELGWPGALHGVTVGVGAGPARSPQPQRGPGVSPGPGEQLQGGRPVVRAGGARAELGMGLESTQFSSSPHSSPLVFLILTFSFYLLLLFLLFLSSSFYLLSPLFFWAAFSSWPSHPYPSSSSLLGLPLGLIITSLATSSSPLLSTPEMTWGHAVCHHQPRFRAGGVTVPSPTPSWPQLCPQLVLMSPGWDRAVSPAQPPRPPPLHVLCSQ